MALTEEQKSILHGGSPPWSLERGSPGMPYLHPKKSVMIQLGKKHARLTKKTP